LKRKEKRHEKRAKKGLNKKFVASTNKKAEESE